MSIRERFLKIAGFIKEHGITPSPRERFYGMRDTIFAWAITAITFTFFETPSDLVEAETSFFIKFFSGCVAISLYVLFESICSGNKANGLSSLLIRDYTETTTHDVYLNSWQRTKYIYTRGIISAGAYIALNLSKDLFGVIDNAAIFGADALVYAVLASFVFFQVFTRREWVGVIIASLGIFFILFFDLSSFSWKLGLTSGVAGIFSALFFSIIFFVSSIIVRHDTPIRIAFHQCVIGAALSLLVLVATIMPKFLLSDNFVLPHVSAQVVKDSVVVGVLYASSIILFLRAFLHTEPIIIAMLGYSMGICTFIFEWFFKGVSSDYKNMIGSGLITIGCSFLIYQEYLRSLFESKRLKNIKPVYQKSLKADLLSIEDKFHSGKMDKYEYLNEKNEFNKVLFEYASLITNSIIERVEILPDTLLFTFKPLNIQLEADGGARSAPFEILNFGSYEPEDESMAYALIQNGDTILDVGAHIGWYSINFAKRFPISKIYAFEPIEYTFEFLKRNIEKNHLSNVILLNFGLSSKEEERALYYFKGGSAIASIENLISHQNAKKITCRFRSLDAILAELGMKSIAFIKCDVEGAELFMLQGAQKTIDEFKPIILIELYEEWCNKCGYSSKDVIDFLASMGYEFFQAINGKLCKMEPIKLVDRERYNYFFLNKEIHAGLISKHC